MVAEYSVAKVLNPDYDVRMNRPSMRLMNETMKVQKLIHNLYPGLMDMM